MVLFRINKYLKKKINIDIEVRYFLKCLLFFEFLYYLFKWNFQFERIVGIDVKLK